MAFIKGFGRALPERVVSNAELAGRMGCEESWIVQMSGILERRWAAPEVSVADMAVRAGEDAIAHSGAEPSDLSAIGMVLVASGSAPRRFPGPAVEVAHKLGVGEAPAIDLPLASAGSLVALALAARLVDSVGDVLVVGAEKMSAVVDREPLDKNTAMLFGDGAGAALVSRDAGPLRIQDSVLHSDGSFAESLRLEFGETISMDGRAVILNAARRMPAAIKELLERNQCGLADVAAVIPHQANRNLTARIAQTLGVEEGRIVSNIERYGNTSSASMLIAASEWMEKTPPSPGSRVVFTAFGAGFQWGALLAVAES